MRTCLQMVLTNRDARTSSGTTSLLPRPPPPPSMSRAALSTGSTHVRMTFESVGHVQDQWISSVITPETPRLMLIPRITLVLLPHSPPAHVIAFLHPRPRSRHGHRPQRVSYKHGSNRLIPPFLSLLHSSTPPPPLLHFINNMSGRGKGGKGLGKGGAKRHRKVLRDNIQ